MFEEEASWVRFFGGLKQIALRTKNEPRGFLSEATKAPKP